MSSAYCVLRKVGNRVAILSLLAGLTAICLFFRSAPLRAGTPSHSSPPWSEQVGPTESLSSPPWSLRGGPRGGLLPTPTPTTVPFLYPPFAGGYRITSYLDHLSPDYGWDDTIAVYTGEQACAIDGIWGRTPTFRGGYWQPESERMLYYDGHAGVDYATPLGTTILAAAPGEVIFAGSVPSGCATPLVYVALEHENGYRTYYVHLDQVSVRKGQRLLAGDPVGISGNSGCSTGPHLHFGVEHERRSTDPYGWDALDRPDPLLLSGGAAATWLWAAGAPPTEPLTQTLTGRLTSPEPDLHTNGELLLLFEPDPGCPPLSHVEFWAYHTSDLGDDGQPSQRWHRLGVDRNGQDGWSLPWDTRGAPEGPVWLHAWAVDQAGRVGKGSPIHDSVTVDRHPPLGRLSGLLPGGTAGRRLWLYVTAEDPESGIRQVDLLARPSPPLTGATDWIEIGQAQQVPGGEWLLVWEPAGPPLADGAVIDLAARLIDRAGNSALTEPVAGIVLDATAPLGQVDRPPSGTPLTTTVDLVFVPSLTGVSIDQVAFWAWYDEDWHAVGIDAEGLGGWQVRWDPANVADQAVRVLARPQAGERIYTALPQVTGLILDRTPPSAGYTRPRTEGVAHPDVAQRVWASDGGSGVARVEFYRIEGEKRILIGVDESAEDGWSLAWDAQDVPDGLIDLIARVYDRAGNFTWTEMQREVALDREPPVGALRVEPALPLAAQDRATHSLILDVTDEVSGLDRAIFYARPLERGGWRHLGVDTDPKDGLRLRWESGSLGITGPVTLTAWVYDRAGNQVELPHVGGVWIEADAAPAIPPLPTPTATATAVPTLSPTDTPAPQETSLATATAQPDPTATPASVTAVPTATWTMTALPAATRSPTTTAPAPTASLSVPLLRRTETWVAAVGLAALAGLVVLVAGKNSGSAG